MVKVNFDDALFSWGQKSGLEVVLARCFSKLHYSHVKREGNMVAYILALFTLNVSNYNAWMEDAPPQFLFFLLIKVTTLVLQKKKKKKGFLLKWLLLSLLLVFLHYLTLLFLPSQFVPF